MVERGTDPFSSLLLPLTIELSLFRSISFFESINCKFLQDKAQERGVGHIVILSERDNSLLVKSFMRDQNMKILENKILPENLIDYLKRQMYGNEDGNTLVR